MSTFPDCICLDVYREKQRREDMRHAFKTLAESMYGEDRDNTKYSEILNHTEPKVQLLNKVSSDIHLHKIQSMAAQQSDATCHVTKISSTTQIQHLE